MKDSIQIILGIAALIGAIYSVFKVESSIYKSIDSLAKTVHDRINALDRDLALHIAVYLERKEQVNLHLNGVEEKIDHAKSRLLEEVKELKAEVNYMRDRMNKLLGIHFNYFRDWEIWSFSQTTRKFKWSRKWLDSTK